MLATPSTLLSYQSHLPPSIPESFRLSLLSHLTLHASGSDVDRFLHRVITSLSTSRPFPSGYPPSTLCFADTLPHEVPSIGVHAHIHAGTCDGVTNLEPRRMKVSGTICTHRGSGSRRSTRWLRCMGRRARERHRTRATPSPIQHDARIHIRQQIPTFLVELI